MILYGTNLINTSRAEFDKATKRIWIIVPLLFHLLETGLQ